MPDPLELRLPPKRDSRKPDPDEPWRYVCPECDGHVQGTVGSQKYRCARAGCRELHPKRELIDQKAEGERS